MFQHPEGGRKVYVKKSKIPNNQIPPMYYNACGVYWKSQNFTYLFERKIMKQKSERNITQSTVIKDRNYGVD